jgi:hypothetical protein
VQDTINQYMENAVVVANFGQRNILYDAEINDQIINIYKIEMYDINENSVASLKTGEPVSFKIYCYSPDVKNRIGVELGFHSLDGLPLIQYSSSPIQKNIFGLDRGVNQFTLTFPSFPLATGDYKLKAGITIPFHEWLFEKEMGFVKVDKNDYYQSGFVPTNQTTIICVPHRWSKIDQSSL